MSSYLPGIVADAKPGTYKTLVDGATQGRRRVLEDLGPLRVPARDQRTPEPLQPRRAAPAGDHQPGLRELIAAYTSYQNACRFCTMAHAAAASELLGSEALVWTALRDVEHCALDDRHKALLRFVGKMTRDLPAVWRDDVAGLQAMGWDDEAIYYTITTCALFNFYNRWITATGVPEMSEEAHRQQGKGLATRGYVRD